MSAEPIKETLKTYESEMRNLPPSVLLNAPRVITCYRMTQRMGHGVDDTNSPFDAEHMKRLSRPYKSELERIPTDARIHSFRIIYCVRLTHWIQRMVGDLASSLDAETLREIERAFNQWSIITRVSDGDMMKYRL